MTADYTGTCGTCKHDDSVMGVGGLSPCLKCTGHTMFATQSNWEPKEVKVNPPVAYTCERHGGGWGVQCPDCRADAETSGPVVSWCAEHNKTYLEGGVCPGCLEATPEDQKVYKGIAARYADSAKPSNPLDVQEGGGYYKSMKIQPVEYIHANDIGFCEGAVIKYVSRWRAKNGVEDLRKARHLLDLLIHLETRSGE